MHCLEWLLSLSTIPHFLCVNWTNFLCRPIFMPECGMVLWERVYNYFHFKLLLLLLQTQKCVHNLWNNNKTVWNWCEDATICCILILFAFEFRFDFIVYHSNSVLIFKRPVELWKHIAQNCIRFQFLSVVVVVIIIYLLLIFWPLTQSWLNAKRRWVCVVWCGVTCGCVHEIYPHWENKRNPKVIVSIYHGVNENARSAVDFTSFNVVWIERYTICGFTNTNSKVYSHFWFLLSNIFVRRG